MSTEHKPRHCSHHKSKAHSSRAVESCGEQNQVNKSLPRLKVASHQSTRPRSRSLSAVQLPAVDPHRTRDSDRSMTLSLGSFAELKELTGGRKTPALPRFCGFYSPVSDLGFGHIRDDPAPSPHRQQMEAVLLRERDAVDFHKKRIPEVTFMRQMHLYQRSDFPAAKRFNLMKFTSRSPATE
eukprot:EG_transcript_25162